MANSGIDAAAVAGTGLGGRITKQDVLSMLKTPAPAAKTEVKPAAKPAAAPRAELSPALGDRPEQRVPMSRLRVRVAKRHLFSLSRLRHSERHSMK